MMLAAFFMALRYQELLTRVIIGLERDLILKKYKKYSNDGKSQLFMA